MNELDLITLLAKLDSGKGSKRIRELKRRGWLTWQVTEKGQRALDNRIDEVRCKSCGHIYRAHSDKCHVRVDQDEVCDCEEFQRDPT